MAKSKSRKMNKAQNNRNNNSNQFKCYCQQPLTDANYSTVRKDFFCPSCMKNVTKEELENLMWGISKPT